MLSEMRHFFVQSHLSEQKLNQADRSNKPALFQRRASFAFDGFVAAQDGILRNSRLGNLRYAKDSRHVARIQIWSAIQNAASFLLEHDSPSRPGAEVGEMERVRICYSSLTPQRD